MEKLRSHRQILFRFDPGFHARIAEIVIVSGGLLKSRLERACRQRRTGLHETQVSYRRASIAGGWLDLQWAETSRPRSRFYAGCLFLGPGRSTRTCERAHAVLR